MLMKGANRNFLGDRSQFLCEECKVTLLYPAQIYAILGKYFKANAAILFMLKTIGYNSSQLFYIPQVWKINCLFLHTRDGDYQSEM